MKWERMAIGAVILGMHLSWAQNTNTHPTLAEMERMYLDGKITAREFQRFLQTYRAQPVAVAAPKPAAANSNDVHARALEMLRKTTPNMAANPQGAAIKEPLPEPVPADTGTNQGPKAAALQDVETKLDELIRLKQAREQTNSTANSTNSTNAAATPKTKRERLDEALRLYIQGKLSDAEYKDRRAKILAEPD
jgi:hypothetical protein